MKKVFLVIAVLYCSINVNVAQTNTQNKPAQTNPATNQPAKQQTPPPVKYTKKELLLMQKVELVKKTFNNLPDPKECYVNIDRHREIGCFDCSIEAFYSGLSITKDECINAYNNYILSKQLSTPDNNIIDTVLEFVNSKVSSFGKTLKILQESERMTYEVNENNETVGYSIVSRCPSIRQVRDARIFFESQLKLIEDLYGQK